MSKKKNEDVAADEVEETVVIEEEEPAEKSDWSEEFTVAGEELVSFVKSLMHEASVRRIVVKNEAKNIRLEIPILAGIGAIALLPAYAALALIAALVADCQILVIRDEEADTETTAAS